MSWRTDAHSPTTPHLSDEQVADHLRDEVERLRDEVARLDERPAAVVVRLLLAPDELRRRLLSI